MTITQLLTYSRFLRESDKIEGIDIPILEYVRALEFRIKNGRSRKTGSKLKKYVSCHIEALFYVIENYKVLPKISNVLELHLTLLKLQPRVKPGRFRPYDVRVGRYICPDHSRVPFMMDDWTFKLTLNQTGNSTKPLDALLEHKKFEEIHPFCDGNGRSGRLIWVWLMLFQGDEIKKTFLKTYYAGETFSDQRQAYYDDLSLFREET